jgi:protein-S-isoprenylcysteine O-methyltransferase Ste14
VDAGPEPPAPSGWRVGGAIFVLPFAVAVAVPALIVAGAGVRPAFGVGGLPGGAIIVGACALLALGLTLFATTVSAFAKLGRGTLAPWDPPQRFVVVGPYRYLRHPMISGVAIVLAAEALLFGSGGVAIVLGAFVAVNAIYLPLVEEPALVRRFGADYVRYMAEVHRWAPRRRPWTPT